MANPILLNVDDHEVARYARSRLLSSAGFIVHEAANAAETFEAVRKYKPDLLLLDVHLPDLNGFEVCRRLKQEMNEDPFIILQITASAVSPKHATTALDGGADAYLTEPMDPDVLVATVRAMLRLHSAERSLAHANRQLEITNSELIRSNADLAHFAFAASHDLQEPLRSISLHTELLQDALKEKLGAAEINYLQNVIGSAARMRALIADLLSYAQVGRESISKSVVNLADVVDWAIANLQETIKETATTIETSQDFPPVLGDFSRLCQVFQNLMSNSIKYRHNDVPLLVRVTFEGIEGANLRIAVSDNGPGIPFEYRDQIFAPFKRLHGSDIPGSGIGLALCRRIVEAHGGTIAVESENRAAGATFHLTLPAA